MRLELDRPTFKRLVQFYLLTFAAVVGALAWEAFSPGLRTFAEAYDRLVDAHFGTPAPEWDIAAGVLGMIALLWHLASAFGLLWYKRWARFGFWASLVLILLVEFFPLVSRPGFQTFWTGWFTTVNASLFGAILLIAYSSDHGRLWFMKPLEKLKETF